MLEFSQSGYWPSQYQLDLWARRERGVIATAWLHRTRCGVADWVHATAELIAAERARVTTLRALLVLDDRALADIGMTRGEVEFALRGAELRGLYVPGATGGEA